MPWLLLISHWRGREGPSDIPSELLIATLTYTDIGDADNSGLLVLSLKAVLKKQKNVDTASTVRLNAKTAFKRESAVFIFKTDSVLHLESFSTSGSKVNRKICSKKDSVKVKLGRWSEKF